MSQISIPRTFWYDSAKGRCELHQDGLLHKQGPIIILGEAGMGKSHVLKQLADTQNNRYCTAARFIAASHPERILGDSSLLAIDALDEVSAKTDCGALDKVLAKLESLNYPNFILSCRVTEWQNATNASLIEEFYQNKPLLLHFKPLQDSDILAYLNHELDNERANNVLEHFKSLDLEDLLGNPQTLSMIKAIAISDDLPNSKKEVYDLAVEQLAAEHNNKKSTEQLSIETTLDAAGAAFAALILNAKESISRKAMASVDPNTLNLVDLEILPDTVPLSKAFESRLFIALSTDNFSYIHRSIGEYLGARWLAKHASTTRKRRRLLSLFQSYGSVPSNLRGLHAWLVQDIGLTQDVLRLNPMGVIQHCGTDHLTEHQAQILLDSLVRLSEEKPNFNEWKPYSTQGLVQQNTFSKISALISDKQNSFALRNILIEAFYHSPLAKEHLDFFEKLAFDTSDNLTIRTKALNVLAKHSDKNQWNIITENLSESGNELSFDVLAGSMKVRSCNILRDDIIIKLLTHSNSKNYNQKENFYVANYLPTNNIKNILSKLSEQQLKKSSFTFSVIIWVLVTRYIKAEKKSDPKKIWNWLKAFKPVGYKWQSHWAKEELSNLLEEKKLREEIQHVAFFDSNRFPSHTVFTETFPPLSLNEAEATTLLKKLDPKKDRDVRWKTIILCVQKGQLNGTKLFEFAQTFANNNPKDLAWLDELANPQPTEWEIKRAEEIQREKRKNAVLHKQHRKEFSDNISQLEKGEYSYILRLAKAYLNISSDIRSESPAHGRIAEWLGEDLQEAAFKGFEAFLVNHQLTPSDIAKPHCEGNLYHQESIFIAAIAESLRRDQPLTDLSDDSLLVCLFSYWASSSYSTPDLGDLQNFLILEIQKRQLLEQTYRGYIEPQLKKSPDDIYFQGLFTNQDRSDIAIKLASEWLFSFPNLSQYTELTFLQTVINASDYSTVIKFLNQATKAGDIKQQRNRLAVQLVVNFHATNNDLKKEPEAALLWSLKEVLPKKNHDIALITWIIESFRAHWPYTNYPSRESVGYNNAWDASEFIVNLINRLAIHLSDDARFALQNLKLANETSYLPQIQIAIAEQKQRVVDDAYSQPNLKDIRAIVNDSTPTSINDLLSCMIEEIKFVQEKIQSDDVDSFKGFYNDQQIPHDEERCRDHLLGLLRQGIQDIELLPEAHVANDKRVDITCSISGDTRLPIEIKGQWHNDLWTAADKQLDRLYTSDHRAQGRGIYLVLWFGPNSEKKLKSRGNGKAKPTTANELQQMLEEDCLAAKDDRVKVVVIDIERETP